jgi:hypothetical protein
LEGPVRRKWIAITLAAVVLPLSLLTMFKLTGVIPESITLEKTIVRDTVRWNMTQPMGDITTIDEDVKSLYYDEASIEFNVHIHTYFHNWGRYDYNDVVAFRVSAEANTTVGFIYSVTIKFFQLDSNSVLFWYYDNDRFSDRLENLTLKEEYGSVTPQKEGYVTAVSMNQPDHCLLEVEVDWVLTYSNDLSHEVNVTLEVIYFNGSSYQKVVMPIQLMVKIS